MGRPDAVRGPQSMIQVFAAVGLGGGASGRPACSGVNKKGERETCKAQSREMFYV
jgi:hypothetical protein